MSQKLLFIIGTRPELIKVFPIIKYLKEKGNTSFKILSTGQHKDLLEPYWKIFDIIPDYKLDIISPGENLAQLTAKAITAIDSLLLSLPSEEKPNIIISQGDTTTVMAASMIAFYHNIKFAHIEAGLRSFNLDHPFPEEFNRRIASITAHYHFAPTSISEKNLIDENIEKENIHVVGNTVVDTLNYFLERNILDKSTFTDVKLNEIKSLINENPCVLITCHRKENHHQLEKLIDAIDVLSNENSSHIFIWPVHPNPNVRMKIINSCLDSKENVFITEPLEYIDLLKVLSHSVKVISDSGGIQEEAPTFKVPVLILRETTERPEAINLGVSTLVGMNETKIISNFYSFNPEFVKGNNNPYGDGNASERIISILLKI